MAVCTFTGESVKARRSTIRCKGLESLLGAWDAGFTWVDLDGLAQCAGECLEDGLGDVVAVASIEQLDVNVGAQVVGDSAAELLGEGERKIGGVRRGCRCAELEVRPVAEIDNAAAQSFVHRKVGHAVATDAFFITECLADTVA